MLSMLRSLAHGGFRIARAQLAVLAALLVVGGGGLAFIELADEVQEGESLELDRRILRALRTADDPAVPLGPGWLTTAMVDFTSLGSTSVLTLLTILTTGYLVVSGKLIGAWLTPVSVGGSALVMAALKGFFERARPDVVPHLVEVTSASFPSGHSLVSTAAYLTLAVLIAETSGRRVGFYVIVVAVLLCLLIGFSRAYLGVHWPTDVLAGWSAGAAWAMACWLVTYPVTARERRLETDTQ
jgi:undecaprenyl-diphosphatase